MVMSSSAGAAASLRQVPLPSTSTSSNNFSSSSNTTRVVVRHHPNQNQQNDNDDDEGDHDEIIHDDHCYDKDENDDEHDDDNDEDERDIGGWDHSILDDYHSHDSTTLTSPSGKRNAQGERITTTFYNGRSSLLSYHAVAIGNVVMGKSNCHSDHDSFSQHEQPMLQQKNNNNDDTCSCWWQTFINSQIHTLATNTHGSVIAVATSCEISLLKGHDGSVLATRQIVVGGSSSCSSSSSTTTTRTNQLQRPQLLFLSRNNSNLPTAASSTASTTTSTTNTEEMTSTMNDDDKMDALLILCPMDSTVSSQQRQQQPTTTTTTPLLLNNVILISNIYGTLLNSSDIRQVSEGAKMMNISALRLLDHCDHLSNGENNSVGVLITGIQGAFVQADTIRFFVEYQTTTTATATATARDSGSNRSIMTVVDYNAIEKKTCPVLQDLGNHYYLMNEEESDCLGIPTTSLLELGGMGMDTYRPILSGNFLLAVVTVPTTTNTTTSTTASMAPQSSTLLLWINILDLSIAAKFTFPPDVDFPLLSCTPVRSYDMKTCVSAAVAYRRKWDSRKDGTSNDSAVKTEIVVIQAVLTPKKDIDDGSTSSMTANDVVPDAMILFTLDVGTRNNSKCRSVDLCSVPLSIDGGNICSNDDTKEGAYAFRYLCKASKVRGNDRGGKDNVATTNVWEFVPNAHSLLGQVQTLIVRHDFDRARLLLDQLGECNEGFGFSRISTPITKSSISLIQLQHILSKPLSKEETGLEAKECLKLISKSVILSGGDVKEVECMCNAATFLMSWPKNQVRHVNVGRDSHGPGHVFTMVLIREVCMALSTMSSAISSVVNVVGPAKSVLLEDHRRKLDERTLTLKTLLTILPSLEATKVTLADPFLAVETTVGLFHALVSRGAFKLVKRLQNSEYGKIALSQHPDAIGTSVLRIPNIVNPRSFTPWLCDDVIPSLAIGHSLLGQIRSFICRLADHYDGENVAGGLDSSIFLLSAVSEATARLTTAMNNCFSFPVQLELEDEDVNEHSSHDKSTMSPCISFDSKISMRSSRTFRPTILNIGMISGTKMRGGKIMSAQRVSHGNNNNASLDLSFLSKSSSHMMTDTEDEVDESVEYEGVESKLSDAIRLKTARGLGLAREVVLLANYSSKGEQFIVKELVKVTSNRSLGTCCDLEESAVDTIRSFAKDVDADFDEAILQYTNELFDNNRDNIPFALQRTQTLSYWCQSPSVRCTIVLKMLRIALVSVQRPPDLSSLAKDAVAMAVDENIRSELQEALRLLTIDDLVRGYCGNGAQEFFRVSDPSHALKLVHHVCRHVNSTTVLSDAMILCDAFMHVSKLDTCVSLLQQTMVASGEPSSRAGQCALFLSELFFIDEHLAESVGGRMTEYCAMVLEDCRKMILRHQFLEESKHQAKVACLTACGILSVMQDNIGRQRVLNVREPTVAHLLKEFQKISRLQSGCDLFLTIEELRNPSCCSRVVSDLLQPSVDLLLSRNFLLETEDVSLRDELRPLVATAKQWCVIICDTSSQISRVWSCAIGYAASQVAKISTNHASLLLLEMSGLLDELDGQSPFNTIVSAALTLFARAFSEANHILRPTSLISQDESDFVASLMAMRSIAQASLLLREHVLRRSPSWMISSSLTLGNLSELMCDVTIRSDFGIGERLEKYIDMLQPSNRTHYKQNCTHNNKTSNMLSERWLPTAPNLHPSWYVVDGLLLHPLEALFIGISCCKTVLELESTSYSSDHLTVRNLFAEKSQIMQIIESRGAHATSLRVKMLTAATLLSSAIQPMHQLASSPSACIVSGSIANTVKNNNRLLAVRCLGGNESGLTSGSIDAQMSVAFLLQLPKETAFKIYQSSLPSAIGKRDFARILTLSSIGTHCGVGTFSSGERFPWCKQQRFIEQCYDLQCNAMWWSILSIHRVSFDPSAFSKGSSQSSVEQDMQRYCEKLVWNAASNTLSPRSTLILASRFAEDYSINKQTPPTALIEYLVSASDDDSILKESRIAFDIRRDLKQTESAIRECLVHLPILNRNLVLRKCIIRLERHHQSAKDYDRLAMVLQLYRECLHKLGSFMKKSDARAKAHEEETGRIERRQDALVIISSIFDKYPIEEKPGFTKLFPPLPRDPSSPSGEIQKFSVLGAEAADLNFDPLAPLDGALERDNGSNSIVAALSPLCSLLQLPAGYLHARSLVVRFRKLKASGCALPSFDSAVLPVAKRLQFSRDRADLAWWCSLQYDAGSVDKLQCLDMAHANATDASEEAERSKDTDEQLVALERVKRIDAARAGLSDKILVDEVLKRHESTSKIVKEFYVSIIDKVQTRAQSDDNYCPENLVQALLIEGSMAAAVASLNDADGFVTHHFRALALLVHEACKSLSDRYSHVSVGKFSRLLTRHWLIHGDDSDSGSIANLRDESESPGKIESTFSEDFNPDDERENSSEFVMDIGIISSGNQAWSADSKIDTNKRNTISATEPSALSPSSRRESSDHLCSRVALRIAFLICFAEDYHRRTAESSPEKSDNENENANILPGGRTKKKPRSKLQAPTSCIFEGDLALQHARELLGIFFARRGSTVASTCGFLFDQSCTHDESMLQNNVVETDEGEYRTKSKALSFAMRHRALRVAAYLCPHEVLSRVIAEETYCNDVGVGDDDNLLDRCAFGSYVAMEIEAMGLPLPHSDLVQLSCMHFPSYARTIWRNHGALSSSSLSRELCGRLHVLLLELCVNHGGKNIDWELFLLILSELERLELPRSLLLACECAIQSRAVSLAAAQKRKDVLACLERAIMKILELIVREVETNLGAGIEFDAPKCKSTLHRLVSVINTEDMTPDRTDLVQGLCSLSSRCASQSQNSIGDLFHEAAARIVSHLTDPDIHASALSIVASSSIEGVSAHHSNMNDWIEDHQTRSVCSEAIRQFENSFECS